MYHALAKTMTMYNGGTYIKNDLGIYVEQHKEKYKVNVSYCCNLISVLLFNCWYIKYWLICNLLFLLKISKFHIRYTLTFQ